MSAQPRFFRKNLIDLDYSDISFTITDSVASSKGESFVDLMRNRDNESGWMTTGSTDAATTTLELNMTDVFAIDTILLVGHNLKSYTLKYWDEDGLAWTDFSTVIAPTANSDDTTFHQFNTVNTSKLQLIINGTMTADSDKQIRQWIVTRKISSGQLEGWPIIRRPRIDLAKKSVEFISGKFRINEKVGGYSAELEFRRWPSDNDLTLLEQLHFYQPRGFLFWPSGGDENQFKYKRFGFRNQDIYLCGISSEWEPEWADGIYKNGLNMKVRLVEVN